MFDQPQTMILEQKKSLQKTNQLPYYQLIHSFKKQLNKLGMYIYIKFLTN